MKQDDGWWTFDHRVAGKSRMKHKSVLEFGIWIMFSLVED